ncbi:Ni,Fe-hydrogenase I cytochrome b subunit [Mucilaginibacter gracilis]|uniref:Ni,Fe-hydrogenase I cytochrome b subunit n=1 Tax=Mucilaginibacter gracilis TaxID=423350 RepID=A0A495J854_9SPHI|nr:cytochrome b/b6 domain-containing protein [Mucilaginibacter gracilis]RKR84554.1 Ni,Fe-hydrogenase I cytochrome b subunit [Mucilaginibacter gracilis]
MTLIEPVKHEDAGYTKAKSYSATLRLWHWANLIVISGSLITVLINSTLTNKHANAKLIKAEFAQSGVTVSDGQARSVAHALGDKTWEIHTYFGYGLAALFLFRLILEFFQVADQKLIRKLKMAYAQFNTIKKNRELARHDITVKFIYLLFYGVLAVMVITGLFLAFEDLLAPYKAIRHSVKEVHGFCMYLVLAFIAVHLIGVFLAERKEGKGIVSDMINGGAVNQ